MKPTFLIFLTATAQAAIKAKFGDAFNASASVRVLGYNISSTTPTPLNWTVEKRIYENDKANSTEAALYIIPNNVSLDTTVDGWSLDWMLATPRDSRNNTDPVRRDCTDVISSDCMSRLGEYNGSVPLDPKTYKACPGEIRANGLNFINLKAQSGRAIELSTWSGPSSAYDAYMREKLVVSLLFARKTSSGEVKTLENTSAVTCFAIDHVILGSRDLSDILKSSASSTLSPVSLAVSGAAGLAALLLVL